MKAAMVRSIKGPALQLRYLPVENAAAPTAINGRFTGSPQTISREVERYVQELGRLKLVQTGIPADERFYQQASLAAAKLGKRFAAKKVGLGAKETRALLRLPSTEAAAQRMFGRQELLLTGLSDKIANDVRETMAVGLFNKKTKAELAELVSKKFDLSLSRARTIAQTEVVRAMADSSLDAYMVMRFQKVSVQAEWTLNVNGSAAPCPLCEARAGESYTLSSARGLIPLHPNCQCGWVPLIEPTKRARTL